MASRFPVSSRRRRRSGGNSLVESVFTLVPTFALIFAFLDFGLMLFRWSTLQNAVREGCRYAITFQTQSGLGQDASIKNVVQQYAMGFVTASSSPQRIFVNYYDLDDVNTPINPGGNIPGNLVEVSVQGVPFTWLFPLSGTFTGSGVFYRSSGTPLTLSVYSSDRLGGYPVNVFSVAR